jgi:hypothetical protein
MRASINPGAIQFGCQARRDPPTRDRLRLLTVLEPPGRQLRVDPSIGDRLDVVSGEVPGIGQEGVSTPGQN